VEKKFNSLSEFYPFYLSEHRNGMCRFFHLIGSVSVIAVFAVGIAVGNPHIFWLALLTGYGCAWIGHFGFEKNMPATFDNPGYSLASDWIMMKDILIGRIPLFGELPEKFYSVEIPEAHVNS
jgi:hypothetical protein